MNMYIQKTIFDMNILFYNLLDNNLFIFELFLNLYLKSSISPLFSTSYKVLFNQSNNTVRNFYHNFPKHVTGILFSYSFVKLILVNLINNFLIYSYKVLNILILVSGNSKTCNRNNFTFWVTENFVTVS